MSLVDLGVIEGYRVYLNTSDGQFKIELPFSREGGVVVAVYADSLKKVLNKAAAGAKRFVAALDPPIHIRDSQGRLGQVVGIHRGTDNLLVRWDGSSEQTQVARYLDCYTPWSDAEQEQLEGLLARSREAAERLRDYQLGLHGRHHIARYEIVKEIRSRLGLEDES